MDMDGDGPGAAIVRSTIDLGHHLGLEVVAEGVETEEQLRELRTLGCDGAQGFHLLRPLPADEVGAWLHERARARPASHRAGLISAAAGCPARAGSSGRGCTAGARRTGRTASGSAGSQAADR